MVSCCPRPVHLKFIYIYIVQQDENWCRNASFQEYSVNLNLKFESVRFRIHLPPPAGCRCILPLFVAVWCGVVWCVGDELPCTGRVFVVGFQFSL